MVYQRKDIDGVSYYSHSKFFRKDGNVTGRYLLSVLFCVLLLGLMVWAMQSHIIVIK